MPSGLKIEGIVISFPGKREAKVSSALTHVRRNTRTVAKLPSETFVSLSPWKDFSLVSMKNLKTQAGLV